MPVNIHGKEYITVAERVVALHEEIKDKVISITTEFLPISDMVVCKATVKIGDNIFTGTSAANPSKAIEKQSPYEVAETSAVGRALGFAGFGIVEGIATADEMMKVAADQGVYNPESEDVTERAICPIHKVPLLHFEKNGKEWWSHKTNEGWCNGREANYNKSQTI